ncbi:MAG TPA: efflux RND transporter periplasmic adaptor subunit [Polyangia bacterium]|jgi:multidrug efflux system membrane fusion protein
MSATSATDTADAPRGRRRGWVVAAILVAAALLVWLMLRGHGAGQEASGGAKAGRGGAAADRVIPVVATPAAVKDVPIYLDGLGTVTAYKTVNIHAQVGGRLDKVMFREGQAVKQGEALAQIDPRPFTIALHQAEAALARDEAQLEGAKRNLDRFVGVGAQHLIPQQQVDDQRALVDQLTGTVASDKAQIETARLNLSYARITSPITGVTGVRQVDPGNLVSTTDANGIVVVTQMDPIAVLFTLPQDDLPDVSREQAKGKLAVEARSRDGDQLLATGELELIDNLINQGTATMRLKAIFPNPQRVLWPNQFVKARLQLTVRKGALVIPAVAVQRGPQGAFVYVVGDDGKAAVHNVALERIEGEQAIVAKGLTEGDKVVSEGQNQLRPGARVQPRQPAQPSEAEGHGGGGQRRPADAGGTGGGRRRP